MTFSKLLSSAAACTLMLTASGVSGRSLSNDDPDHAPDTNVSRARCMSVAFGGSATGDDEIYLELSTEAAAYICDGTGSAEAIAKKTADSFALAVAGATVQCEQVGETLVQVDAKASAVAEANVWIDLYFSAYASAGDCEKCSAFAQSFGYITKYVFLKAVADAEVHLDSYTSATNPRQLVTYMRDYDKDLKQVFVEVFSASLSAAANFKEENGCLAFVNAGGCIWTEGHEEEEDYCVECAALAYGAGATDVTNAIAEVNAEVFAWTCGDSVAEVDLHLHANALAKATAVAVSYAFASCRVDEGGYACASAENEIESWVIAVADAWARMWTGAANCEGTCDVDVEVIVDVVGKVLVTAATEAFAAVCGGEGVWTVEDLETKIKEDSLCAIADATVFAISEPPYFCLAGGTVIADASQPLCPVKTD